MAEFSYRFSSVIRGHHVYKAVWTPIEGELLDLMPETENENDRYAIGIRKDNSMIVGHVPKELSRIFYYFIQHNGTIQAEVIGHRKRGKGLEVPCDYILTGKPRHIQRAKATVTKKLQHLPKN